MRVLLISDGTFVARHAARRLIDLGHIVLEVRPDDFGGASAGSEHAFDAMTEQVEAAACDRVLCLLGGSGLTASPAASPLTTLVNRATRIAKSRGARFVLASAISRATSARLAMLGLEQQVARAVWEHGLDGGVCRIEGLYGGRAEPSERHALLGPLLAAGMNATPLQVAAPLDALHWPLHVRDAVDGIVHMLAPRGPSRVRLAGAVSYRTRDLVATIETVLGTPMSLTIDHLDERRSTHPPHISEARRLLRWRPRVGLFAGVEEQAFNDASFDVNLGA